MRRLRVFYLLTITQVLSIIGSMMTGIAVSIRVFTDTGDSTPVLMTSFFSALPMMVAGMFAGVLVDRWQRRAILMLSDAGQSVGAIVLIAVFSLGVFQLWHLYAVALVQGLLAMLQRPAMEASVTMLVPRTTATGPTPSAR
jgi:MFS family permease